MKKLFTLLTLMLFAIGTAWAGDVYKLQLNGENVEIVNGETSSSLTFFSYNSGKHNFNTKFNGVTYDDVEYISGLKMEGSTKVSWTSTASSTVTIVQSTWSDKTIKLDDTELAVADAEAGTGCRIYTITNVAAGEHSMTRGSGESGVFAITVEYTGSTMTQLTAPEITINASNGDVTIGSVENAAKITYTIDGSDPSAESTEYSTTFTVEDGVTVKAIAIGDNERYINSTISSKLAVLENVTIATPVIKQFNGTVAITCETAAVDIEYSLDGTNYTAYTRAFTLTEDGKVYARAKRGEKTSEVVSEDITTISKGAATKTIWMGHGSFTNNDQNVMTGSEGDEAEGIILAITGNTDKKWSSGNAKITIGSVEKTAIKLSNGAQNTMTLPEGMTATRITFYSFINDAEANTSYWSEFNGETINGDVPMGAANTVTDRLTNPDVRVFPLNGESSITFTNAGKQLCFIVALDVIESQEPKIKATSAIALKAVPYNKTSTATITLTGSNLTDGTYEVTLPSVDGLSIDPTSFTVEGGAVEQTFTVTYTSENDVESATANIVFSDGTTSAETAVTYESRGSFYEQTTVSAATTWDWTKLTENIELKESTTPTNKEAFVLKELEYKVNFGSFDAQSIVVKGANPVNSKKIKNCSVMFKTTTPGTLTVEFSDTGVGGESYNRYLNINGLNTDEFVIRNGSNDGRKTTKEIAVPAGEITISGARADGTNAAICIYKITFTPADAPTITATITDAGYATFSSLFEVEIPEGVTAYYASASAGSTVTMTSIDGGYIPAGTGVVLKGAADTYTMTVSNTGATLEGTNLLKANIADRTPGEEVYYTLAAGPKFSKSTGGTLAAGKAYLVIPTTSPSTEEARIVTMKFDGEATGISEMKSVAEDGTLYNLSGVRVNQPTKGLYIQNGKKIVVK